MKGTIIAVTLLTLLLISVQTSIAINLQSNNLKDNTTTDTVIIVDKTGEGDYSTICEAIKQVQDGSIIIIKSGEYKEILTIDKQITLIGEDRDSTIINPTSKENKYAIQVKIPNVRIENLSISNSGPGIYTSGIYVLAPETTIKNCNFYDNPIGIILWSSYNIISNCNFWGCADEGIALIGTPHSDCVGNKISDCMFYDNCDGIELQYSSNNEIKNCVFFNNTHTGIDAIASSNDNNIISDCNIYNNRVHGIYFSDSSENQIIDCSISNNQNGDIIERKNCINNLIRNTQQELENIKIFLKEKLSRLLKLIAHRFTNLEIYSDSLNRFYLNF